uniref:Uncharacterized protein n=1 Tax=Rhizophora mucronata TaxID=61149 RepID=A0A2P2P8I4_RHIMU
MSKGTIVHYSISLLALISEPEAISIIFLTGGAYHTLFLLQFV